MAKEQTEPTLGYKARLARRKGERRIERLENVLRNENPSERMRNWATKQIKEIKSAMQGTRQYSTSGKRYKSKTKNYINRQLERLNSAIKEVVPRFSLAGDSFEVTQHQINLASVKKPSVYTKAETQVFYYATQKIWQKKGIGEHDRNQAILDYYNSVRKANNLTPYTLEEIVDFVLDKNKTMLEMQRLNPEVPLTDEQEKWYETATRSDNSDGPTGSPKEMGQAVINQLRDALDEMFVTPKPEDLLNEQ